MHGTNDPVSFTVPVIPRKKTQFDEIRDIIMAILEGYGTEDMVAKLCEYSGNHGPDCALGATPACICGQREAENFLKLLGGKIDGEKLIRS